MSGYNQNQGFMNTDQSWMPNLVEDPLKDFLSQFTSWGNTPNQNTVPLMPQMDNVSGQYDMSSILGKANANINSNDPSFLAKAFSGYQNSNGDQVNPWAPQALNAISGLGQSWLGMQQLGLAKEQFAFQKDSFQKQYDNQTTLTNASQRDRQSARVAAAPGAYQSVGEYMQQNKVG